MSYGPSGAGGGGPTGKPMKERQFTPRGQMSGEGAKPPIAVLEAPVLSMFLVQQKVEARPPMPRPATTVVTGVAQFLSEFETTKPPAVKLIEQIVDRRARVIAEKLAVHKERIAPLVAQYEQDKMSTAGKEKHTENPFCTLFVGKLSYDVTERRLRTEFERHGNVRSVRLVTDKDGKSRGYAFVEFETEAEVNEAFRKSEGRKLDGMRFIVDVERGRTVKNWLPVRLGGGLGGRKAIKGKAELEAEAARRETGDPAARQGAAPSSSAYGGGHGSGAGPGAGAGGAAGIYGGGGGVGVGGGGGARGGGGGYGDYDRGRREGSRDIERSRDRGGDRGGGWGSDRRRNSRSRDRDDRGRLDRDRDRRYDRRDDRGDRRW